jgi:hypothetical protein
MREKLREKKQVGGLFSRETRKRETGNGGKKCIRNQSRRLLFSLPPPEPEPKASAAPVCSTKLFSKSFQLLRPSTTSVKSLAMRSTISCSPPLWPELLSIGRPSLSNRGGSSSTSELGDGLREGLRVLGWCLDDRLGRSEEGSERFLCRRWRRRRFDVSGDEEEGSS